MLYDQIVEFRNFHVGSIVTGPFGGTVFLSFNGSENLGAVEWRWGSGIPANEPSQETSLY